MASTVPDHGEDPAQRPHASDEGELDADAPLVRLANLGAVALGAPVALLVPNDDGEMRLVESSPGALEARDRQATLEARDCCRIVAASGEPLIRDAATRQPLPGSTARPVQAGFAHAAVPLADRGGRTVGGVCASGPATRRWTAGDLTMLRELGTAIAREIELRSELLRHARTEGTLRESEGEFRAMFEGSPLPKWVFDLDTLRFLDVNEAAIRRYGYSREEFLSMTVYEIRPAQEIPRLDAALARGAREMARYTQVRHRARDGSVFEVDATAQEITFRGCRAAMVVALEVTVPDERDRSGRGLGSGPVRGSGRKAGEPGGAPIRQADFSSGTGSPLESLREQIAAALHLGHLVPGDRLPSIRVVAESFGISPYEAVRAYRALEAEGCVETRSRSGIYVAPQHEPKRASTSEATEWLVEVLVEACRHQVRIPALPELVSAHTAASPLRCVCIAGDRDTLHALCREMDRQFGFTPRALSVTELPEPGERIDTGLVHEELRGADLLVTTAFHAPAARRLAEALGTRMAVVTLNPEHTAAVEEHARQRQVTVVCVDPAFGERIRALRGGRYRDRIEVVPAGDVESVASIDPAEPVFLTRAAHDRLGGRGFRLLAPFSPFLSPWSTRALVETLVDLNLRGRRS